MVQIGVIGDVHRHFDAFDVAYFNQSAYDLLLFVGDLANYRPAEGIAAARMLARLKQPALFVPGNHDAITLWQLLAEVQRRPLLLRLFSWGQQRRVQRLRQALGDVVMGSYSTHAYQFNGVSFDVIVGRPFAMGGDFLNFRPYLQRNFGVNTMADSAAKLCACVDAAHSDQLLFLAHCGPQGLGAAPADIWGCDFSEQWGDFGEPDLAAAIAYAQAQGKRVTAVIAGHMHRRIKGGGQRRWRMVQDGVQYVNAARVPRIFTGNGRRLHHHVRLTLTESGASVADVLVEAGTGAVSISAAQDASSLR